MTIFEWSNELSVGVKEIDEQHKRLIDYINVLHDAVEAGENRESVEKLLDDLIKYTEFHFSTEERMMYQYLYVSRLAHKEGHEHLLFQVRQLQQDLHKQTTPITWGVLDFLKAWLLDHILHADKLMGEYLNSRRVF
ncbi:MAG: hemerythrin family protein [Betaproteobacteria bacterium]|nr:hemerythrin family protein [Betaproteobacteria bacterium]